MTPPSDRERLDAMNEQPLNHDGEPLHTGDDDRIDCVTGIRAALDDLDDPDGDDSEDVIAGIREECDTLDKLIIDTIRHEREASDGLAALEHERDELQAAWTEARGIAERSIRKRQEAEAALLSLQTAVREREPKGWYCSCGWPNGINLAVCAQCGRSPGLPDNPCTTIFAALLPDPAGTPPQQKDHEDKDFARAHGDAQAAIDRIYRVQQNGEK